MVLVPSAVPVAAVLKPTQVEKTTKPFEIWSLPFRLIAYLDSPSIERASKGKSNEHQPPRPAEPGQIDSSNGQAS